jgi:hypothetical protein
MNDKILSTLFKAQISSEENKSVQKAQQPQRTDMSQMKLTRNNNIPEGLQEQLSSNSSSEADQKLSRTERRKQERDLQKKR